VEEITPDTMQLFSLVSEAGKARMCRRANGDRGKRDSPRHGGRLYQGLATVS
jgi:hypothetical protein